MSEREDFINQLSGDVPDSEPTQDAPDAIEPDQPDSTEQDAPELGDTDAPFESEAVKSLLDELSEPDPNAGPLRGPDGKFLAKNKPEELGAEAVAEVAPVVDPLAVKPPQDEAEALIAEMGVKSERGQERIRATFAKIKEKEAEAVEYRAKATELETDMTEFRDMVQSTGLAPEEFVDLLETSRLIKSNNPAENILALEKLDAIREHLAKVTGRDVPGVDVLSDFPDLKHKVENLEVTREHAIELAKYRRQDHQQRQAMQHQQQRQQADAQYQQEFQQAATTATAIFDSFKHEVDHPAKMKMITDFVRQPGKMQEIAATYQPHQLPAYFRDLYVNLRVAPPVQQHAPQPLRSRPANVGSARPQPGAPLEDTIFGAMDRLGI